jgi:hypothetical protein
VSRLASLFLQLRGAKTDLIRRHIHVGEEQLDPELGTEVMDAKDAPFVGCSTTFADRVDDDRAG